MKTQSYKDGGFTPKSAAASIAIDALAAVLRRPEYELELESANYRKRTLQQVYKLAIKLMEANDLDGYLPEPEA